MAKTIDECAFFGFAGVVGDAELRACGCERCLQELRQREAWEQVFGDEQLPLFSVPEPRKPEPWR